MSITKTIQQELKNLFLLKKTTHKWHSALLASFCVGIPLLIGLYFNHIQYGLLGCLSGLVILYLPKSGSFTNRMVTILICSFGFLFSFTFGQLFSFNPVVSAIAFGLFSLVVHWMVLFYKTSPPGSFFFILIASLSSCMPFDLAALPTKTGLVGLGTMLTCILALIYTLLNIKTKVSKPKEITPLLQKNHYADFMEAIIMGIFMFLAMSLGHILKFHNPYWIAISCAAVMQGASLYHIWQRSFHRILGTFIGIGTTWLVLNLIQAPIHTCITIIVLQFIIEILVVRQYALAVIFITPLTILLADAANPLIQNPDALISLRFYEISIGSLLGALGGWVIHKEKIRYLTIKGIQKISVGVKRKIN